MIIMEYSKTKIDKAGEYIAKGTWKKAEMILGIGQYI